MKKCPKCGRYMTQGSPHSEGYIYQWECHGCGYNEPVGRTADSDGSPTMFSRREREQLDWQRYLNSDHHHDLIKYLTNN